MYKSLNWRNINRPEFDSSHFYNIVTSSGKQVIQVFVYPLLTPMLLTIVHRAKL